MTRLLYFTAAWCGPCRAFGPLLSRVAEQRGLDVEKVDVDDATDLALQHDVIAVPTVIALDADGNVLDRFGALAPSALKARLDALTIAP